VKAVVDTNVIAYYLLGTASFASEAGSFWRQAEESLAPALWEAELTNVIWMAARSGALAVEAAPAKLDYAAQLGIQSVESRTLWRGALRRSLASGVAAYDTLFVELADRESLPLVTFDVRLLKMFPKIAKRPKDLPA
jgi:predicted nucleic acid-binding protein